VALDLARDGWACKRGELDAALRLEAIDGLDQPDRPDLHQVVELRSVANEVSRDGTNQREIVEDQSFARSAVV
jgi:hypothetical protein